jgi:hypothetical protein
MGILTGSTAAVWWEAVTRRNGDSRVVRTDLRNGYFRSRAKLCEVAVGTFCERFHKDGAARPDALQVPSEAPFSQRIFKSDAFIKKSCSTVCLAGRLFGSWSSIWRSAGFWMGQAGFTYSNNSSLARCNAYRVDVMR